MTETANRDGTGRETAPQSLLDAIHEERLQPLATMPHHRDGMGRPREVIKRCAPCETAWFNDSETCPKCNRMASSTAGETGHQSQTEPALRYDAGKTPFAEFDTYFDPGFAAEIGAAFAYGAAKYGRDNWKKGMSWSRCLNSARRHILAFWRGNKTDPESGIHHLAHAVCSLMFLFAYERGNIGKDDR